jgi:hypothetical protein
LVTYEVVGSAGSDDEALRIAWRGAAASQGHQPSSAPTVTREIRDGQLVAVARGEVAEGDPHESLAAELRSHLEQHRSRLEFEREALLQTASVAASRVIVDRRFSAVTAEVEFDGLPISTQVAGSLPNPMIVGPDAKG